MLSLQDKLALALTSAGSQRNLAKLVGVSHQRIGRMLREGAPGGIQHIPESLADAIDSAFELHKDVSRDQAESDGIPFDDEFPAFTYRGYLRTGEPGDRVITENTEFISSELRTEIIEGAQRSKKYIRASIRSIVDWQQYAQRVADEEKAKGLRPYTSRKRLGEMIFNSWVETGKVGVLSETHYIKPVYTRYENISPGTSAERSAQEINRLLQQKHESSAVHLADEYIFQLLPAKRNSQSAKNKQALKRSIGRSRKPKA